MEKQLGEPFFFFKCSRTGGWGQRSGLEGLEWSWVRNVLLQMAECGSQMWGNVLNKATFRTFLLNGNPIGVRGIIAPLLLIGLSSVHFLRLPSSSTFPCWTQIALSGRRKANVAVCGRPGSQTSTFPFQKPSFRGR